MVAEPVVLDPLGIPIGDRRFANELPPEVQATPHMVIDAVQVLTVVVHSPPDDLDLAGGVLQPVQGNRGEGDLGSLGVDLLFLQIRHDLTLHVGDPPQALGVHREILLLDPPVVCRTEPAHRHRAPSFRRPMAISLIAPARSFSCPFSFSFSMSPTISTKSSAAISRLG